MRHIVLALCLVLAIGIGALLGPSAGVAQNQEALVTYQSLKPDVALELAQAALKECRQAGYQVAITVADRFGHVLVTLRDQFAGPHTVETATRKAWTAVSFRTATLELTDLIRENKVMANLGDIPGALALGGGVPVNAAGILVGGIGISGAPGADLDHACAVKAIGSIQEKLDF